MSLEVAVMVRAKSQTAKAATLPPSSSVSTRLSMFVSTKISVMVSRQSSRVVSGTPRSPPTSPGSRPQSSSSRTAAAGGSTTASAVPASHCQVYSARPVEDQAFPIGRSRGDLSLVGHLLWQLLLRPAYQAAYHDGDHTENHGDDPEDLPTTIPALQAEVVAKAAEDDAGELYGDAVDQEEAEHCAQDAENAKRYTDRRLQSLLAPFRGKAVDPLVGLGAGHVLERLAEAILQALDTVLTPPLDGQRLQKVDLALARLPRTASLRGGWFLRLAIRGVLLCSSTPGRV